MNSQNNHDEHVPTNTEVAHKLVTEFMYHFRTMYGEQYYASKKAHRSLQGHLRSSVKQALDKKSEAIKALQGILEACKSSTDETINAAKNIEMVQHQNRHKHIQEITALVEEQRNPKPPSKPLSPIEHLIDIDIERMIDNVYGVRGKAKPRINPQSKAKPIGARVTKTPKKPR